MDKSKPLLDEDILDFGNDDIEKFLPSPKANLADSKKYNMKVELDNLDDILRSTHDSLPMDLLEGKHKMRRSKDANDLEFSKKHSNLVTVDYDTKRVVSASVFKPTSFGVNLVSPHI